MKNTYLYSMLFVVLVGLSINSCTNRDDEMPEVEPYVKPISRFIGTHSATVELHCQGENLDPNLFCDTIFQSTISISETNTSISISELETNTNRTIPFYNGTEEGGILTYANPDDPIAWAKFYLDTDSIYVSSCVACGNGGSITWSFSVDGN